MSLPSFFSRIFNAVGPLVGSTGDLLDFLSARTVRIRAPEWLGDDIARSAGFFLSVNLCARLYPRIVIDAPSELSDVASQLVLSINPRCELPHKTSAADAELSWELEARGDIPTVNVCARGWEVLVDSQTPVPSETNALTALSAGAIGIGELFRTVFAKFLQHGRREPSPAQFRLLSSTTPSSSLAAGLDLGEVHLVGAGAIGQAFIHALSQLDLTGKLTIVDPEAVELSNLQRYVLSFDADIGKSKVAIASRALATSGLQISQAERYWGEDDSIFQAQCVCTALDSALTRISVQASLPRYIYNAWTQPDDLGWSRHEHFGKEPCLACLYVPSRPRSSQHELISEAFHQHQLRVLAYLTLRLPVDQPLKYEQIPKLASYPIPEIAGKWTERSILDDIIVALRLEPDIKRTWKGKELTNLYREGICGGAIVSDKVGTLPQDVIVPLAHQSALAGIMLAAELVTARSADLSKDRDPDAEARLNVLAPLSQLIRRPRQRTPGCICSDAAYVRRYQEKWGSD